MIHGFVFNLVWRIVQHCAMVASCIPTGDANSHVTPPTSYLLPPVSPKSNPMSNLVRVRSRSTPLSSGWTIPRPVSTSGSVLWSTTLSLGCEGRYRRILHALDSYAWDHASDTGNNWIFWQIREIRMLLNDGFISMRVGKQALQ